MAMAVAEVEAGVLSIRQRLHEQTIRFWIGIHKLNGSHPHSKLAKTKGTRRFLVPEADSVHTRQRQSQRSNSTRNQDD